VIISPPPDNLSRMVAQGYSFNGEYHSFNCRSACTTQDHRTYAECMRAAHIGVGKGESAPAQFA
jgi:hypothetical protein